MALKDTDASAEYPYIFMIEQSIYQDRMTDNAIDPVYTLSLAWTYYNVEDDGSIVYTSAPAKTYFDPNFHTNAVTNYLSGDNTHLNTLGAQQFSILKIVQAETGRNFEVV